MIRSVAAVLVLALASPADSVGHETEHDLGRGAEGPSGVVSITSASNGAVKIRHCSFQAFATTPSGPSDDFRWTVSLHSVV